jgi:hypothetical protein
VGYTINTIHRQRLGKLSQLPTCPTNWQVILLSWRAYILRKASQSIHSPYGNFHSKGTAVGGGFEGYPHRFTLVHALLHVKKGTEGNVEVRTRNTPPLPSTDLGRAADALPTLLVEDAQMSISRSEGKMQTTRKSWNGPMSGGRACVLSLSDNHKLLLERSKCIAYLELESFYKFYLREYLL